MTGSNVRQRRLRRTSILLSIFIIGLICAQWWLWRGVRSTAEQWHESRSQEQQVATAKQRLSALEKQYRESIGTFEQLTTVIPRQSELPRLIDRLETEAGASGVTLLVRSISEEDRRGTVLPVVITANVTGSASGLLRYLDSLEHLPELVQIRSWQLKSNAAPATAAATGGAVSTMDILMLFYVQPT